MQKNDRIRERLKKEAGKKSMGFQTQESPSRSRKPLPKVLKVPLKEKAPGEEGSFEVQECFVYEKLENS